MTICCTAHWILGIRTGQVKNSLVRCGSRGFRRREIERPISQQVVAAADRPNDSRGRPAEILVSRRVRAGAARRLDSKSSKNPNNHSHGEISRVPCSLSSQSLNYLLAGSLERSTQFGLSIRGSQWGREQDTVGAAFTQDERFVQNLPQLPGGGRYWIP